MSGGAAAHDAQRADCKHNDREMKICTLPRELYGQIAAYVADSLCQGDVEVHDWYNYLGEACVNDRKVEKRKHHKQIQCLMATCKTFNTEVMKRLRTEHLAVIKEFWNNVIDMADDSSTFYYGDGRDVHRLSFERLWYGEYPKSICLMLHRKNNLFTMQCGRKEYEGPKICLRITNGTPIDGKMADYV
jgi:hypothetical protein